MALGLRSSRHAARTNPRLGARLLLRSLLRRLLLWRLLGLRPAIGLFYFALGVLAFRHPTAVRTSLAPRLLLDAIALWLRGRLGCRFLWRLLLRLRAIGEQRECNSGG